MMLLGENVSAHAVATRDAIMSLVITHPGCLVRYVGSACSLERYVLKGLNTPASKGCSMYVSWPTGYLHVCCPAANSVLYLALLQSMCTS